MYKKGKKIIATILLFVLTLAQLNTIGQVFASNILEEKNNIINEETATTDEEQIIEETSEEGTETIEEETVTNLATQIELEIDDESLSTLTTNEDVKITAILKTDTSSCNLYKDPILYITLPKYIENIDIKEIEVLFITEGSKLTLKSHNITQNEDGTKLLTIELEGTQTEHTIGAVSKGVNVIITSDLTLNKLTPNNQDKIKLSCLNQNTSEQVEVEKEINFVGPIGVVTATSISNYAEGQETIMAISKEETAIISIMSEARNATFTMNVINNYNTEIDNISILGRLPFEGNKDILSNEDLGSTINVPLTSNITLSNIEESKVKIYYSENGEATKELDKEENGWTLTPANLSNVKSYLIILEEYTMNKADSFSFSYTAQIPEKLQHNESAYQDYVVYFGTMQDKEQAAKLGITTGQGPVLETTIHSSVNETEELLTGKFIKYTVDVKNIADNTAEDVIATIKLPKCTNYIEFFEGESGQYLVDYSKEEVVFEIGDIAPNETITKDFFVIVDRIEIEDFCSDESHYEEYEGQKYHKQDITHKEEEFKLAITAKATITAKDLQKALESNEIVNNIKNAYINIMTSTTTNGLETLNENDTFKFNISVQKYDSDKTISNTVITYIIPEGLSYENAKIKVYNEELGKTELIEDGITYDSSSRTVSINLGEIQVNDNRNIIITTKVETLPENIYEKQITSIAKVSAEGIEETSNPIIDTIAKEAVEIEQISTIPEGTKISAGEEFAYKFIIKNIGGNAVNALKFTDNLPEELQYINTQYTIGDVTKTINNINSDNRTEVTLNIPKGETLTITVNVIAKELGENTKIENKASISTDNISLETNTITHTIEKYEYYVNNSSDDSNKTDSSNSNNETRKIMGTVWIDSNNDAAKEENETRMTDVEVMLFNNETAELVRDSSGNVLKQITNEKGNYSFENIPQGKYTVIFIYDTANYSATTYRSKDVDSTINSDAVDTKITLDGVTIPAAITEEIIVTNSNIYNIDLGLVLNPKFDLKLDKTVAKITLQHAGKTEVYNYKDVKIAKKDLIGKDANDVSIIVEYKIKVTNEGAISGYVKKIVDYMPSEMKFNSDLNKDWYISENGALYNSSLSNTLINPGESKEVTLLLTKKMTEDNLGLYHNEAEIYEAYNDLGIEDTDSKEANKVANEDDISSADVLITVKTGKMIQFVGLSITIILTIGIGAYFIKKKVLR